MTVDAGIPDGPSLDDPDQAPSERLFAGMTAEALVTELYRNFFKREPDPAAKDKAERLLSGVTSVEGLVAELIVSEEYRTYTAPTPPLFSDQTQFGELEMLVGRWMARAVPHRTVVDVGARGRARSNSYDLLRSFGWKGILFEANPNLIDSIGMDFAGLDMDLVQCAVSDYDGEATFYLGVNDDVSSLNEYASLGWGPVAGEVTVPVRRLGPQLEKRGVPLDFGLLSIDIEGEDIRVLNDVVASGYRPRWVIIEASLNFAIKSLDDLPFDDRVKTLYALVGQTPANLIMELRADALAPQSGTASEAISASTSSGEQGEESTQETS